VVPGPWGEAWLSQPRFDRYLAECRSDRELALATYEWNLRLGHAVLRDAAHFEVALRNAYDSAITARWSGSAHWLTDATSPVQTPLWRQSHGRQVDINRRNRDEIADAVTRAGGANSTSGQVVAELSFGFWRHLADTGHERAVWVPLLHHAWPSGTSRVQIDAATRAINSSRNRAAHCEPMFAITGSRSVLSVYATIINLLTMLNPELASYVHQTSQVPALWANRP